MRDHTKRSFLGTCIATGVAAYAGLGATAAHAQANPWPAQPIRIVVPFAPGGANDVLARVLTEKLSLALGQAVIAENRPGAGGTVGASQVAASKPDGYTLMMLSTPHLIAPIIYKDLPYDALTSFAPVARLATSPFIMVVNPSVPAKTVSELVALAKAQPGKLNFGSSGNGSNQHLFGQMFLSATGTDMKHVPYKGSAPATVDLVGGQVQVSVMAVSNALPHLKTGRLRALAVVSGKRRADLPDVPTMAEAGVAGLGTSPWIGMVAPKGTPPAVIARTNAELRKILADPEAVKVLNNAGLEADYIGPDELAKLIRDDSTRWLRVARSVNLKQ
ncbi:MAG: hypothetical protein JWQ07_4236 [Ramlibacter sp.]|nr:hypothetical protein [Ramlibacter sp.]